jgi:hypothetical protein
MRLSLPVVLLLPLIATQASAFYLPGAAPRDYEDGEDVELDVNVLKPGLGYESENLVCGHSSSIHARTLACSRDEQQSLINCAFYYYYYYYYLSSCAIARGAGPVLTTASSCRRLLR